MKNKYPIFPTTKTVFVMNNNILRIATSHRFVHVFLMRYVDTVLSIGRVATSVRLEKRGDLFIQREAHAVI